MSPDRLTVIASFESSAEAFAALSFLETEGIEAFLREGASTDTLWYLNLATGGVKLQVRQEDADRAAELLRKPRPLPTNTSTSWRCARCQETMDAGFEVCWSCGGARDKFEDKSNAVAPQSSDPVPIGFVETLPPPPAADPSSTNNPYASPQTISRDDAATVKGKDQNEEEVESAVVRDVQRAYRAAIIGLVFCPFALHIYSLVLLIYAGFSSETLDGKNSRRYYIALVIDLLVLGSLALLVRGGAY